MPILPSMGGDTQPGGLRYASEDEVLRDALGALEQREQERLARWDERNRLAIEQSKQGLSRPLDDEKVLARLRERLANEWIRR